jgi:hypothetical protein
MKIFDLVKYIQCNSVSPNLVINKSIIQTIEETLLLLFISVNFMRGVARQLGELGDILIHRHGPLFHVLKLLLL